MVRLPRPVDAPRDWIFGRSPNPFAQRVSSPGTFTRSLAYHTSQRRSGGERRGAAGRGQESRRVKSTANNNPSHPVGRVLLAPSPTLPVGITIRIRGLPSLGPSICFSNGRTAQSVPIRGTPFFFHPSPRPRFRHADPLLLRLRKSRDPWDRLRTTFGQEVSLFSRRVGV